MQQISISYLIRLTIRRYLFTLQFTIISKKKKKQISEKRIDLSTLVQSSNASTSSHKVLNSER